MGSLVGGSATIGTAWITQKTQSRRDVLQAEFRKRESLYSEFITEISKLAIDALDHSLDDPEKAFVVYALENASVSRHRHPSWKQPIRQSA